MKVFQAIIVAVVLCTAMAAVSGERALIRTGGKERGANGYYYISSWADTYFGAKQYCASEGLQLLEIKTNGKQEEVILLYKTYWSNIAPDRIWLNAAKTSAGILTWGDGTAVRYNQFLPDATGDCLDFIGRNGFNPTGSNQYYWRRIQCTLLSNFVCEEK